MNKPEKMISLAVALCFVILAMVWARAFYGSKQSYLKGVSHLEKNKYIEAITFFDRSIHWHTPFNPYVRQSAERLWEIGLRAEQEGDIQLAFIAIRTISQGFYAGRGFYTPGKDWILRCDAKIASLTTKEPGGNRTDGGISVSSPKGKDAEPDVFWTLILEIGFLGWIGSVLVFLMRSLTEGQTPSVRSKSAIFCGIMFIVFYSLWIFGMMKA